MLPLVTSAIGFISRTKLGERVKDKIGDWIQNKAKFGKKARAGQYNKTTDIQAFATDKACLTSGECLTGTNPWPSVLGEKIKQIKDAAGPIETDNTVSLDKSTRGVLIGVAAFIAALFIFKK